MTTNHTLLNVVRSQGPGKSIDALLIDNLETKHGSMIAGNSLTNQNESYIKVLEDSKFGFLFFQLVDLSRIQPTFTTKMTLISASKFVSQVRFLFIIFVKSCSEQHTGVEIL